MATNQETNETMQAAQTCAEVKTENTGVSSGEKAAYIVFAAVVALAIITGWTLPRLLNMPEATVEKAIMVGMVPFLLFVLIKLR